MQQIDSATEQVDAGPEKIDARLVRDALRMLMEYKQLTPGSALPNRALALLHVALTGKRCSPDGPVGPDFRRPRA